jgi:hypothetical protein
LQVAANLGEWSAATHRQERHFVNEKVAVFVLPSFKFNVNWRHTFFQDASVFQM